MDYIDDCIIRIIFIETLNSSSLVRTMERLAVLFPVQIVLTLCLCVNDELLSAMSCIKVCVGMFAEDIMNLCMSVGITLVAVFRIRLRYYISLYVFKI